MRKRTRWLVSLGVLALGSWFLYRENNVIDVSRMTVTSSRLPEAFDGYRVVQVADLHGKAFGNEQERLLNKIDREKPDLVVMTGDLIDSRRNGEEAALTLMKALVDRYPVYFVTGNHEVRLNLTILPKLEQLGVTVLRNESRVIEYQGQSISLLGIDDPTTTRWREGLSEPDGIRQSLDQALQDVSPDAFQLLLAHRPEYKSLYAERSIDLVLSGHAHGGQIRLPFTEGLYAPGQGFFPTVTAGRYQEQQTELIVSRGLGNSLFPFRLFNHPELVVLTLKRP